MSRPILPTTSISSVPSLQSQSSHSPTTSFRVLSTSSSKGKEKAVEIPENGLLVPTDRDRDELEGKWLHHLGRFRVHSEMKLQGYSLYSLRTWYLSRTHWAQTIATPTGPRDQISVYLLVPDPELSDKQAKEEMEKAIRYLINESGDHPSQRRKTEYGILLINKAQNFGQDVSPIPGGDLREAKPYMIVNTGLRRLGCGARAALGIEPPAPALRRKFHELYKLPQPPQSSTSPPTSPLRPHRSNSIAQSPIQTGPSASDFRSDPFAIMVQRVVELVQAGLAIWGLYGSQRDELDINGLFCDETKAGIFKWRQIMGMEKETLKLEKETSGGCIDPKTLAALLSSVTSVTYEMRVLGVDGLPKDPFRRPRKFLNAWRAAPADVDDLHNSQFLDVDGIRALSKAYLARRTKSPFSVHHSVLSGVAHATSSISANLKGSSHEDGPLRRRELRPDYSLTSSESGLKLITPDNEVIPSAPPDVITTNLEAYTNGIKKSKEKDWIEMGAKRIGDLWKGNLEENKKGRGVFRRGTIREEGTEEDSDDNTGARGALVKTGKAFKGLVARKGSAVETSDSEGGGKFNLARRKQSMVPTVLEPDLEEVDEQVYDRFSVSPSPSGPQKLDVPILPSSQSSRSHRSNQSKYQRPSIITDLSNGSYEIRPRTPSHHHPSQSTTHSNPSTIPGNRAPGLNRSVSERAEMWRERGTAVAMLRTSSTGADVRPDETGNEWEVLEPHGTGKGQRDVEVKKEVRRRHSQQDIKAYQFTRVEKHEHLAVDVEMCSLVLELRQKEKELAKMNTEMKILAESIILASREMSNITIQRQSHLTNVLQPQIDDLETRLNESIDAIIDTVNDNSVRQHAQTLVYMVDNPQYEAMKDRIEMLGRQYRVVQAKAAGRQAAGG